MQGRIINAAPGHIAYWLEMTNALWPDAGEAVMEKEFFTLLSSADDKIFFVQCDDEMSGFIHATLRNDYVEGTNSSPVGYVEGIYVKENYRKKGLARLLIKAAEEWCKEKNITELASDAELNNIISHRFHKAAGFEEATRIVCFVKKID